MPGSGEILVIFLLVLVLFGPDRLPDLARGLGKGLRELRKVSSEFQNQINQLSEIDPSRPKPRPADRPTTGERPAAAEQVVPPAHPDSLHARETQASATAGQTLPAENKDVSAGA